jgi:hypothetical protein
MLMIPATPFEKFFSRWLYFQLCIWLFTDMIKVRGLYAFTIYSLAYTEKILLLLSTCRI